MKDEKKIENCISLTDSNGIHRVWGFYIRAHVIVSPYSFHTLFYRDTCLVQICYSPRYYMCLWTAPKWSKKAIHICKQLPVVGECLQFNNGQSHFYMAGWKLIHPFGHVFSLVQRLADPRLHGKPVYGQSSGEIIGAFFSPDFNLDPYIVPIDILLVMEHPGLLHGQIPQLLVAGKSCRKRGTELPFRGIDMNIEKGSNTIIEMGNGEKYAINVKPCLSPPTVHGKLQPLIDVAGVLIVPDINGRAICIRREHFGNTDMIIPESNAWIICIDDHPIEYFEQFVFLLKVEHVSVHQITLFWSDQTCEMIHHGGIVSFWWLENIDHIYRDHNDPCIF